MSKYDLLWEKIDLLFKQAGKEQLTLKFEEIENLCGITIDHSFLTYKKDLQKLNYTVKKISLKEKTIIFERILLK